MGNIIIKKKINIIIINTSLGFFPLIRDIIFITMAKIINIPCTIIIHGWEDSIYQNKFFMNIISFFLNNTRTIIVLSKEFKEKLKKYIKTKIYISSTMVDTKMYQPIEKDYNIIKILFCANLEPRKGAKEYVETAKMTYQMDMDKNIMFSIIGNGSEMPLIKNIIKKYNLEDKVNVLGYISSEKKISQFKEANLFIYPSYYGEGFPNCNIRSTRIRTNYNYNKKWRSN